MKKVNICGGVFEFDEREFDQFKIEKPDISAIKSQIALLKLKELKELSML